MKWLKCKHCKKDYWGCETHQTIWRRNYCDQGCKQASMEQSFAIKKLINYIKRLTAKELSDILIHVRTGAFDLKEILLVLLSRKPT